jgi:hypothetical protein
MLASLSEERRAAGHGDELGHPVATRHEGLDPLDAGHAWPGDEPARGRFNSGHPFTERGHQPGAGPGRAQCLGQTPQLTEAITSRGLGGKTGS